MRSPVVCAKAFLQLWCTSRERSGSRFVFYDANLLLTRSSALMPIVNLTDLTIRLADENDEVY